MRRLCAALTVACLAAITLCAAATMANAATPRLVRIDKPVAPCVRPGRSKLTLCDVRLASAKLAAKSSSTTFSAVARCWLTGPTGPGCWASERISAATLAAGGLAISGDTGPIYMNGRTEVRLRHGRVCATWTMIYGATCV